MQINVFAITFIRRHEFEALLLYFSYYILQIKVLNFKTIRVTMDIQ